MIDKKNLWIGDQELPCLWTNDLRRIPTKEYQSIILQRIKTEINGDWGRLCPIMEIKLTQKQKHNGVLYVYAHCLFSYKQIYRKE